MKDKWVITDKREYSFDAKYYEDGIGEVKDGKVVRPIASFGAYCKWDGCMDIYSYFNGDDSGSEENTDQMHICDIKEFIKVLQELVPLREAEGQEV